MSSYISRRHLGKRARPNYVCYHCNRSLGSWESIPLFLSLRTGLEVLKVKIKKRYNLCLNLSKKTISKRRFLRKNIFIIFFFHLVMQIWNWTTFKNFPDNMYMDWWNHAKINELKLDIKFAIKRKKIFIKKKPSECALGKKLSMSYLYYYCIKFVQMTIWYGLNMAP